jgi:hypothetical protein
MDLINDLGTDLALAFLVEKRFGQKIESEDAALLIGRIRTLLESDLNDTLRETGRFGPNPAQARSAS